ncbi:MAG: hypothetical protein IJ890_07810 [Clostridia bacterium]|nr:hypothetical protein [Clostridia bacterium]
MEDNGKKIIPEIPGLKERMEFVRALVNPSFLFGDDIAESDADFNPNHDDEEWFE